MSMRMMPPRFVIRTMIATLTMVAFVLSAVFIMVTLDVRDRVRATVAERLETGQRMLSALEQRRAYELQDQIATLAENPTLKAAIDTYQTESRSPSRGGSRAELIATVQRELDKLTERLQPSVLAVVDEAGAAVAIAGRHRHAWVVNGHTPLVTPRAGAAVVSLPAGVFRVVTAELVVQDTPVGTLQLGTALDDRYVRELSTLSGAPTLVVSASGVVASTLPAAALREVTPAVIRALPGSEVVKLAGTQYAVRSLFGEAGAGVYVLDSIDAAAAPAMRRALDGILIIALSAFAMAGLASVWLARTVARPVDMLSRSLSAMTTSGAVADAIPTTGLTREVDSLIAAFNTMMQSVSVAQAETRSAYVGAIRALALALDARDPYTAGHSERVSTLSVAIGRQMGLSDSELDVLRLGALLHDIGKIGISDDVLRKPGPLTAAEFEVIKTHPTVGARILRSVPFLAPHIPIVELHHERPDGNGYPHQMHGDEIPMAARIVHVADAFDAMTSARAYRPGRGAAAALRELWRCAGAQFDAEVVQALANALPAIERKFDDESGAGCQSIPHPASRIPVAVISGSRA
jgi:putative nucleotidyltransferase with HDIG domain